jgi:hypothetical protein
MTAETESPEPIMQLENPVVVTPTRACPKCGAGQMILIEQFPPVAMGETIALQVGACLRVDTS